MTFYKAVLYCSYQGSVRVIAAITKKTEAERDTWLRNNVAYFSENGFHHPVYGNQPVADLRYTIGSTKF